MDTKQPQSDELRTLYVVTRSIPATKLYPSRDIFFVHDGPDLPEGFCETLWSVEEIVYFASSGQEGVLREVYGDDIHVTRDEALHYDQSGELNFLTVEMLIKVLSEYRPTTRVIAFLDNLIGDIVTGVEKAPFMTNEQCIDTAMIQRRHVKVPLWKNGKSVDIEKEG